MNYKWKIYINTWKYLLLDVYNLNTINLIITLAKMVGKTFKIITRILLMTLHAYVVMHYANIQYVHKSYHVHEKYIKATLISSSSTRFKVILVDV